jgi:hypothetical protein
MAEAKAFTRYEERARRFVVCREVMRAGKHTDCECNVQREIFSANERSRNIREKAAQASVKSKQLNQNLFKMEKS